MPQGLQDAGSGAGARRGRDGAPGSPIPWAVLGLVIEKPSYGYELARRFERRFDTFLSVSASNIYTTLDRLARQGLIEEIDCDLPVSARRQRRLHYRATADGARSYREWLMQRLYRDERRTELLVRLASMCMRGPAALEEVLDLYETECMSDAEALDGECEPVDVELMPGLMRRLFELERRLTLAAQMEWVAHAREELRRFAARRSGS